VTCDMHAFVVEGWGGGYALCPLVDCELQVGSTDLVPMLSGVEFRHLFCTMSALLWSRCTVGGDCDHRYKKGGALVVLTFLRTLSVDVFLAFHRIFINDASDFEINAAALAGMWSGSRACPDDHFA